VLLVSEDETIATLRRLCDRNAGRIKLGQGLPRELIDEMSASLPHSVFRRVDLPAIGADGHHLSVRIDPAFYWYMADAAEYCFGLAHGHISPQEASGLAANAGSD